MMQYVKVTFPSSRDVFIDGSRNGKTNEAIRVDEGMHEFTLGSPQDSTPDVYKHTIMDTTSDAPFTINFKPCAAENS